MDAVSRNATAVSAFVCVLRQVKRRFGPCGSVDGGYSTGRTIALRSPPCLLLLLIRGCGQRTSKMNSSDVVLTEADTMFCRPLVADTFAADALELWLHSEGESVHRLLSVPLNRHLPRHPRRIHAPIEPAPDLEHLIAVELRLDAVHGMRREPIEAEGQNTLVEVAMPRMEW